MNKALTRRIEKLEKEHGAGKGWYAFSKPCYLLKFGKAPGLASYREAPTLEQCRKMGLHNIKVIKEFRVAKIEGYEFVKFAFHVV